MVKGAGGVQRTILVKFAPIQANQERTRRFWEIRNRKRKERRWQDRNCHIKKCLWDNTGRNKKCITLLLYSSRLERRSQDGNYK